MSYSSPKGYDVVQYWGYKLSGPIRRGNRVTALVDGNEAFMSMYEALSACIAQPGPASYIYLLAWYLDSTIPLGSRVSGTGDREPIPGSSLRALFIKAEQTKQIQIRAILWGDPNPYSQNAAECTWINQLSNGAAILDSNTPRIGYSAAQAIGGAHHQKVLIVKSTLGLVAFCGGVDINRDRIAATPAQAGSPMHDVHCRIEGPAANDLVHVFAQRWLGHPKHSEIESSPKEKPKGKLRAYPADIVARDVGPLKPDSQYVRIARTFNFVGNGKTCQKEYSIQNAMIRAIKAARDLIYVEDQYFTNFYAAGLLRQALETGLQHLVVLTSDSIMVEPVVQPWQRRRRLVAELMKAPRAHDRVHIFTRKLSKDSRARDGYIHAKTWIIDDELAVIGSANFDRRGWGFQTEVAAFIFDKAESVSDPSFAHKLRMKLWSEHLGVSADAVKDGLDSVKIWLKPPLSASIEPYQTAAGEDANPFIPADDAVDPPGLKSECSEVQAAIDEALKP